MNDAKPEGSGGRYAAVSENRRPFMVPYGAQESILEMCMSPAPPRFAQTHAPTRSLAVIEECEAIPNWAKENDDNLLRFLFVAPQPCAALDALIARRLQ